MNRTTARSAGVVAALLVALGAAAWWMWPADETTDAAAPPRESAAPARGVRVEGATRRVRSAPEPATAPSAPTAPRASLLVRVLGSVERSKPPAPLPGAAVYLMDAEGADWRAVTSDGGAARFEELPPGSTVVHAEVAGRKVADRTVVLKPDEKESVDVYAVWTGTVRGVVRDPDGRPVDTAWVRVTLASSEGRGGSGVTVDDDGRFEFKDATAGESLTLTAGAPEWGDAVPVEGITLEGDPPAATRDVVLRRLSSVVVRVFDPAGRPADASLWLDGARMELQRRAPGEYVRERIQPGDHTVSADAKDLVQARRGFAVAAGETAEVELRFEESRWIEGVVVDTGGAAVARAVVAASRPDADAAGRFADADALQRPTANVIMRSAAHALTGPDGRFRIGPLGEGDYLLTASSESHASSARVVAHAPSADARVTVTAITRVKFRLVGREHDNVPGAVSVVTCAAGSPPNRPRSAPGGGSMQMRALGKEPEITCTVAPDARALCISGDDFAPVVISIVPRTGELTDLGEVRVEAGLTLRGRVVAAADGSPVEGATVVVIIGPSTRRSTRSDRHGTFAVEHLAAGPAAVYAATAGFAGTAVLDVARDAPVADVRLRTVGTLQGVVRGADGAAVPGATVAIRHWFADEADDFGCACNVTADADGRFRIGVTAGRCLASAGGAPVRADVPEGGEATVTLTLEKP